MAPAPATSLLSRTMDLTVDTPSSTALSRSSSYELVDPLSTMVAILFSSSFLLKIVAF